MSARRRLKLLLIEDSDDDATLVLHELKRGGFDFDFERVETEPALLAALDRGKWDIVLSDYSLPRLDAPTAFGIAKTKQPDVPFIIVSGTVGEETAVEAMKLGVQDYVLKGKLVRLCPAVERELRERQERQQAAAALRYSEERYRLLFEGTPLAKLVFDPADGRILAVNEAAVRQYGYDRATFASLRVADLFAARDAGGVRIVLATNATVAATHRHRDGTPIEVELRAHDVELEGARARLVVATDVTDRKRAEEALRRTEEQLRQAQKMEAVGRLAGGIAHDFNNLLTVIMSFATLAEHALQNGHPVIDDLREIRSASERAAELTRQLLAFGRQQVLEPTVVDLGKVVLGIEKMLRRVVGEDVELSILGMVDLGRVHADIGQIEQVIMNLVINARDAMPRGGKLTIELGDVDLGPEYAADHIGVTPGPYVMVAVTDTGEGMDAATQARIFEPFFTTKEAGKGTGLGLATVFGIVAQSGGHIWVYSEVGVGTTFKMYFPRTDRPIDQVSRGSSAPTTLRGTETVLVVEDDPQVRAIITTVLGRQGYTVLEASSGDEAAAVSASFPARIHLLISDVVMPRMGGPELAEHLASARPDMKVLFMSGYTNQSAVHHGVIESGTAFLQKPITPDALAIRVRSLLEGGGPE